MFNTKDQKHKTENTGRSWARKALRPEFNKSFLNIKVAVDSFVRLVAIIFLNSGLLDEEDSVFDNDKHLGFADFGEIVVVAAKNINWRSIHSIPQICLWLSSVLLIVFAISLLIVLLMGLASSSSMAATPPLNNATYDDLFTLSPDMQKTEYGTTWINWLFALDGQNRPIINGSVMNDSGIMSGFRSMLIYYSSACLVLGSIMVSYLFVNVVVDTASTGKFMGQHDEVWAFPRILMAMAFLVPYGTSGLNIGQHVVIYLAKTGSVFATNAWSAFLTGMDRNEDNMTVVSRNDLDLDKMADLMFDSYVCYWGTQIGSQVMTSVDDKIVKESKDYLKDYLEELKREKPQDDKLPPIGCTVGSALWYIPGYQHYGFLSSAPVCEGAIKLRYKDGSDEEIEAMAQFSNMKDWIDKYNSTVDSLKQAEDNVKSKSSIFPTALSSRPVIYYKYQVGRLPIVNTCGTYGPPEAVNKDVENLTLDFDSKICTEEEDLASMLSCTEKKMKNNLKYAYLTALNNENVYGFRKAPLSREESVLLVTPDPMQFDVKEFTLRFPDDAQKRIIEESGDESISLRDDKSIHLPAKGSLSSYAFDMVYSIFKDSKYRSILPIDLNLINEDSQSILDTQMVVARAKSDYIKRFKDSMEDGMKNVNKAFRDLNTNLFGKNKDGSWKTKEIGHQIDKGWVSAGAFYSLLSKISGLGLEMKTITPYISGPSSSFIGSVVVDTSNYNSEKSDEKESSTGTTSKIKYLDYVMTQNEQMKENLEKATTGRSSKEAVTNSYTGVSLISGVIQPLGLDNLLTNIDGANPISQLVNLGHVLINVSIMTWVTNVVATSFMSAFDETLKSLASGLDWGTGVFPAMLRGASYSIRSLFSNTLSAIIPILLSYLSFGFILAYYLPLLPFIRFTMGAIGWFAAVFQAVLGMPMLMLGSISTSKGGIILGPQRGKYMMIVEIFFRPILMVFGMIGAILMLSLATYIFTDLYNFAWGISSSVTQHRSYTPASLLAGFAYIGIYVSTMYTIANTSFKMIDDVPQQVISWMGGGAGYNMGGPEAALGGAEKGLAGAADRITKSQGGVDKSLNDRREQKSNKEKDMNNDINDIQNTMVKDGPQSAQLSADLKGYKIVNGQPVVNKDKKSAEAYRKRALDHLDSGGTAKDYMVKDNKPESKPKPEPKPKPNDMDDDGGTPS